jgi:hypothetical protein
MRPFVNKQIKDDEEIKAWCNTPSGLGKERYQNLAQRQEDQQGVGGFCAPTADYDPHHPMGYGPFPQRPNQ